MLDLQILISKQISTYQLPTPSHHEGTSVVRDVEELKKGKGSHTIEQRIGDNIRGVSSPHHHSVYENAPPYEYYYMSAQSSYPFHESGYY
ncbi:hypothetical protein M9H77_34729 [Catharanthus roseus]|uniref:Uncharacterized protein n=1 Tax=Catharanthus roseus TaxID=4058 RepID=A0ACB9ZM10_CATRO|nr:hypothetical protein M9H77_34729 [Catharanthus roseus]